MFGKITNFLGEVKMELTKVSWPTRQELIAATWVIIVVTALLAIYIGIIDLALSKFLNMMIR